MSENSSPFWLEPLAPQQRRLGSGPQGLTDEQAGLAFKKFGPNRIQDSDHPSCFSIFASILANPLVLVLLLASGISAALGEATNAIIIVVIVTLSSALEFTQTYRSSQAAQKLVQSVAVQAEVMRSGKACKIPQEALVPGDLLVLSAGSLIAADARLVSARDLSVVESALTGESLPAEKQVQDPEAGHTNLADAQKRWALRSAPFCSGATWTA